MTHERKEESAEARAARVARMVRRLPEKTRQDAVARLDAAIEALESMRQRWERERINGTLQAKLASVVSGLRTARLLISKGQA